MIKAKEVLDLFEDKSIGVVNKDEFVGDVIRRVSRKSQLKITGEFNYSNNAVLLIYHLPITNIVKPDVGFHQTSHSLSIDYNSQFDIPLRSLETLCGKKFKKTGEDRDGVDLFYEGILSATNGPFMQREKDILVYLFCSGRDPDCLLLVKVSLAIFSMHPDIYTHETVYEIPLSPDQLNKLIDATADAFIGYKKLINQFNNRPMKKTNADW
jgi:hypothetical protein